MQANGIDKIQVKQLDEQSIFVNGIAIDEEEIEHEIHQCSQSRERAAATLVIRQLLLQKVDADVLIKRGEERAIQQMLDRHIRLPEADEESCRRYYDNNRHQFHSPDLYEASHILLAAAPDDFESRNRQRDRALRLIKQLKLQPERFSGLAQAHSDCPSGKIGGSLGQIGKGSTVPELEDVLFRLETGLYDHPVESRFGYHVLRVNRKVSGEPLDYPAVRQSIASHLYRHNQQQAVCQFIEQLVAPSDVRGIDLQALRKIHI